MQINHTDDPHTAGAIGIPYLASLIVLSALALSGCGVMQRAGEPEPAAAEAPVVESELAPQPAPEGSVADALSWIESGDFERALALLDRLVDERPGSATARLLLRQLRTEPDLLLPGPYREIELAAGESLSMIAERELGNPLYFVGLARLNGIRVPSRVAVGTLLRVPEEPQDRAISTSMPADETERAAADVEQDLLTVADYLVASGQVDQALNLLYSSLAERGGSPRLQSRFADIGLARVDGLRAERSYAVAAAWLDDAAAVVSDTTVAARIEQSTLELELGRLLELATAEQARGDIDSAFSLVRQARELAPGDLQAQQLEQALREPWTRQLHEEALLAWRARDIDRSIRIWQQLLETVPDFEPARVYLERALELRRRLQ